MFFSNTHWPQLTAPFYSILFETSICQFNSSKCSPITPDEVREHLTRDQRPFLHPESLQTLQIHRSMTVLLQFTSLIFYRVQVREHLTRDQRHSFIQNHSRSFRFTDPWRCFFSSLTHVLQGSDSQIHDGASSVHLTHLLQGSGQRTGMAVAEAWCCAQWPIFVLFLRFVFGLLSGWKIQTWPIIRFITESVTYWFLSVGIW